MSCSDKTDVACCAVQMLMPEIDLGYEVTHITLNTDGSSLLLAGSHNINVLYVHERVSEDGDTIICRYISSLQLHLMFIMHSCSYIS
jgi:nuclear pore complex protein Nup88